MLKLFLKEKEATFNSWRALDKFEFLTGNIILKSVFFKRTHIKIFLFFSMFLFLLTGSRQSILAATTREKRGQKADSLFLLGMELVQQGKYDLANTFFLQACTNFLENRDSLAYLTCLIGATNASFKSRNFHRGDSLLRKSETVLNQINNKVEDTVFI